MSSASQGRAQESTVIAAMSQLTHHGIIYVLLGYKTMFHLQNGVDEVRGGSLWGAGTFAGGDMSRQPTATELSMATEQGKAFWGVVSKAFRG